MLAKIYGVFTLKRKYMKKVTVMLMENTIQTKNPKNLLSTYDLKGSTHGRVTKNKSKVKPTSVQKDLDLLDAKAKSKKMFEFNALNRKLRAVLLQDTQFLQQHGFLDYSLLLAVEKSDKKFDLHQAMTDKRLTRGLIKRQDSLGNRRRTLQMNPVDRSRFATVIKKKN